MKDPTDVVKVGQKVQVTVLEVDLTRRRIGLSMRSKPEAAASRRPGTGSDRGTAQARPATARPQAASRPPAADWFTVAMNKAAQAKARRGGRDDN